MLFSGSRDRNSGVGVAATRKGAWIVIKRTRLFIAGLVAVLIGMPLARETYAQSLGGWVGYLIDASIYSSDGGGSD
jgi:hypothetical protein